MKNLKNVTDLIDKGFHGYANKQKKVTKKQTESPKTYAGLKGHRK